MEGNLNLKWSSYWSLKSPQIPQKVQTSRHLDTKFGELYKSAFRQCKFTKPCPFYANDRNWTFYKQYRPKRSQLLSWWVNQKSLIQNFILKYLVKQKQGAWGEGGTVSSQICGRSVLTLFQPGDRFCPLFTSGTPKVFIL